MLKLIGKKCNWLYFSFLIHSITEKEYIWH